MVVIVVTCSHFVLICTMLEFSKYLNLVRRSSLLSLMSFGQQKYLASSVCFLDSSTSIYYQQLANFLTEMSAKTPLISLSVLTIDLNVGGIVPSGLMLVSCFSGFNFTFDSLKVR
jgi:hypothetical protein